MLLGVQPRSSAISSMLIQVPKSRAKGVSTSANCAGQCLAIKFSASYVGFSSSVSVAWGVIARRVI